MTFHGSCLSHPIAPSVHGTLQTTAKRSEIIAQSIASIIETRQGERVMVPDYGIPDFVFAVVDAGFTARLGHFISEQVRRYEPLVDQIRVTLGMLDDSDGFIPGFVEDQQRAALHIVFTERGSNTPHNLVYPTWRLRT